MSTKYFVKLVENKYKYAGGFDVPPDLLPPGLIEIPAPPEHGLDEWDGQGWIKYAPPDVTGLMLAVSQSTALTDLLKVQLYSLFPMLTQIVRDSALLKLEWARVKLALGIGSTTASAIEQLAAQHNVPLV